MGYGVHLHAPPKSTLDDFVAAARLAARAGVARIGVSDSPAQGMECWSALTVLALNVSGTAIGPRVTNPVTRHPGVTAAGALGLPALGGCTSFVALGRGDSGVINLGAGFASLGELREYATALRHLLTEGVADYRGGRPAVLWPDRSARVPVIVAAEGPRTLAMAGAVADGVLIGAGLTEEVVTDALRRVREGAEAAGRDADELEIWWSARLGIDDDPGRGRERARSSIVSQANHALAGDLAAKHVPVGLRDAVARFRAGYDYTRKGARFDDNPRLADALGLSDYLMRRFGVAGSPDQVRERLAELRGIGVTNVWLSSPGGLAGMTSLVDALRAGADQGEKQ